MTFQLLTLPLQEAGLAIFEMNVVVMIMADLEEKLPSHFFLEIC